MFQNYEYLVCKSCGTTNRVLVSRDGRSMQCGKCKMVFPSKGNGADRPLEVNDQNFEKEVIRSALPVLLDCWAPWCSPCRLIAPTIDQIAKKYSGKVKVAKLNTDENPQATSSYGILSIPTLLIFRGGKQVDRMVGVIPRGEIERRLSRI